ncbi:MAG: DNA repair protein RecO [Gemmatimonadota bacterium]
MSVPALILRGFPYGESSRILRFITPEHGLVGAIARGARRPRSRFSALLDPFGEGVALLSFRQGRDLQTLTAFDLTKSRRGLGRDLRRYGGASVLAELLLRTATGAASSELFERVGAALDALEVAEGEAIESEALGAAWTLVHLLGFAPELAHCTRCGREVDRDEDADFDYAAGGLRCADCPGEEGTRLPAGARAALRAMVGGDRPTVARPYAHWILLERFLAYHVLDGAPMKSLAFLLDVRREEMVR